MLALQQSNIAREVPSNFKVCVHASLRVMIQNVAQSMQNHRLTKTITIYIYNNNTENHAILDDYKTMQEDRADRGLTDVANVLSGRHKFGPDLMSYLCMCACSHL